MYIFQESFIFAESGKTVGETDMPLAERFYFIPRKHKPGLELVQDFVIVKRFAVNGNDFHRRSL